MANVVMVVLGLLALAFFLAAGGALVAGYLLASELRLFLRAPSFYVRKLTSGPGPEKQARAVVGRILGLLPARSPYADHLRKQVKGVLPAIRRMVEQQDRIQLYLEYDVYNDQLAVGREDPDAVRTLEQRKAELTQRLDSALTDLKRIETRVAAHVLGARDSFEEEAVREELSDTLEDLGMLLEEDKAAGLLPES